MAVMVYNSNKTFYEREMEERKREKGKGRDKERKKETIRKES